ncbi:MAG: hypothetical protein ACM3XM_06805 [Mycobacterium leprae]
MSQPAQTGISLEMMAVIAAAVAAAMDQPLENIVIRSVEPEPTAAHLPSAWAKTGLVENMLSRRQFGLRNR